MVDSFVYANCNCDAIINYDVGEPTADDTGILLMNFIVHHHRDYSNTDNAPIIVVITCVCVQETRIIYA
jgi:hypothetical protein